MRFLSSTWLKNQRNWQRKLVIMLVASCLLNPFMWTSFALAQAQDRSQDQIGAYCQLTAAAIAQKDRLRRAALENDQPAIDRYKALLSRHANLIRNCRSRTWPQNQAIWLRLYPCDIQPGALEALFDHLINRGYNQVYVESFYNGQVLLPAAQNRTPWPSVIRAPGYENRDLLAESIAKGRERGLKVYAWLFSMNFGYTYAQRPGTQPNLAINGRGQTSLTSDVTPGLSADSTTGSEETFIDPYSLQAKRDYYLMEQAIAQRQPDGMLFDYIRYPRGSGTASIASRVQDLWIYGSSAQQALLDRATNQSGREIIRRFLNRGYITATDVQAVDTLYPQEREPLWQGRTVPAPSPTAMTPAQQQPILQAELWRLSVAHAVQGVLDFLAMAVLPAQRQNILAGAVFFPEGNLPIGQGYDSRLQPWDRFPSSIEWHPMSYANCGNAACIVSQVQRVVSLAPPGTQVMPVLAGLWGQPISNRPALEVQMQAIRRAVPQINSISHFAFSWQEPQMDRDRKFCQLR